MDREKARCSTWYEMFPRSCASEPGRHGTLRDCEARLSYVAAMGFDVLYLPPIHLSATQLEKEQNNEAAADRPDVGSPWAIGSEEGGHTKHPIPELGTLDDFDRLIALAAKANGIEIALDVRSSARLTTLMYDNIRNGFAGVPTAPSNTRKTRPRNTRTFSLLILRRHSGADMGGVGACGRILD